jgi:hypothetical protein
MMSFSVCSVCRVLRRHQPRSTSLSNKNAGRRSGLRVFSALAFSNSGIFYLTLRQYPFYGRSAGSEFYRRVTDMSLLTSFMVLAKSYNSAGGVLVLAASDCSDDMTTPVCTFCCKNREHPGTAQIDEMSFAQVRTKFQIQRAPVRHPRY